MALRKGVLAIIIRDGKFLLLRRVRNWKGWEFPKGGIDGDEEEEEALLREIQEETGLTDVTIRARVPYVIKYNYPGGHPSEYSGAMQSVFIVDAPAGEVKTSEEHDGHKWVSYGEAMKELKHSAQKNALREAGRIISGQMPSE